MTFLKSVKITGVFVISPIYKCAIPVHACSGHVLLSKCRDCVNMCVQYIQDICMLVLTYMH